MTLVHIDGKQIVNLDHVMLAEFRPSYQDGQDQVPDTLKITLSGEVATSYDENGLGIGQTHYVFLTGDNARDLWSYLENRADIPNMENAEH